MSIIEESTEGYKYFLLKNGSRITSFRVKASDLSSDLNSEVENMSKIYPGGAEIYPISQEEHLLLHKINSERRRLVKKARKRCIDYNNAKFDPEKMADAYNTLIGVIPSDIL